MLKTFLCTILCLFLIGISDRQEASTPKPPSGSEKRLEQLVEANIIAVHAFQILLARKEGHGDAACYPKETPSDSDLQQLDTHQQSLPAAPPQDMKNWVAGSPSKFDPSKDLQPLLESHLSMSANLPVNVFTS